MAVGEMKPTLLVVEIHEDRFRIILGRGDGHQISEDREIFDRSDELDAAVDVLVTAITSLESVALLDREHGR